MNRATEGAAPIDHGGVEMRMRDRDRLEPAEALYHRDGRIVEKRDAVPEHIACWCDHKVRVMTDRENRQCADADQSGLVLAERIGMARCEPLRRDPALARGR